MIAYIAGALIGGIFWGYLFGLVAGRFLFPEGEPQGRAFKASIVSFFACFVLSSWGSYDDTGFDPVSGLLFIPGVAAAFFLLRKRYRDQARLEGEMFD